MQGDGEFKRIDFKPLSWDLNPHMLDFKFMLFLDWIPVGREGGRTLSRGADRFLLVRLVRLEIHFFSSHSF